MSGYPKFKTLGDSLSFEVRINGNLYLASISGEALWSHFGGGLDDAGLMAAYFANEEEIHAVATKHIRDGDLSPSLTLRDFENRDEARGYLERAASREPVGNTGNVSTFFRRLDQDPHLGKLANGILDGPDALHRLMELAAAMGLPFTLPELAESGELDWFEFGMGSERK